jgi:hypothetical protein
MYYLQPGKAEFPRLAAFLEARIFAERGLMRRVFRL